MLSLPTPRGGWVAWAPMNGLSVTELAERAGVAPDLVERLQRLQILIPSEAGFRPSDVYRVRLLHAFEEGGLSLESIGEAVSAGKLSFAFLDMSNWRWAPRSSKTYAQVSAEAGLPFGLLASVQEALEYERPEPDDFMREDDLRVVPLVQLATGMSIPQADMLHLVRAYSEAFRQLTVAETHFFHTFIETPLLQPGMDPQAAFLLGQQAGEQFTPLLEEWILALYRRGQERAWTEDVMEHVESALEEIGLYRKPDRPPAILFLDLSGYTRLTEERGDRAAADLAGGLAEMVQRTSRGHGGRPVKWLGDGVMFHFKDPGQAVTAALEMVQRAPQAAQLPAHAGLAAGPVVTQGGDYFGRTVNMASRIAARATEGQTLVSDEVVEAAEDAPVEFREFGTVELKGVSQPVRLHEALPVRA
jgi:adenylate cyclase